MRDVRASLSRRAHVQTIEVSGLDTFTCLYKRFVLTESANVSGQRNQSQHGESSDPDAHSVTSARHLAAPAVQNRADPISAFYWS